METTPSTTPGHQHLTNPPRYFANDMLRHLTVCLGMSWNVAANAMLTANVHGDAWLPEHYLTAVKSGPRLALYTLTDASSAPRAARQRQARRDALRRKLAPTLVKRCRCAHCTLPYLVMPHHVPDALYIPYIDDTGHTSPDATLARYDTCFAQADIAYYYDSMRALLN